MKALFFIILQILIIMGTQVLTAQDTITSNPEKIKKRLKNSVKFNVTNPMIFGENCYTLGYERTIGDHQSFSVNIGRFSIPRLVNFDLDSIENLSKSTKSRGLHISGDYRFYLAKENKHKAPRGVYIGPFFTYNAFKRDFLLDVQTSDFQGEVSARYSFGVGTAGFQLGYQFIFWNRVSLDMILFGPGIGFYRMETKVTSGLDPETKEELYAWINEAIGERIPGWDIVISPDTFNRTGSFKTTSLGYRYVIMLGIRF